MFKKPQCEKTRLAVIGAGAVGSTVAYTALVRGVVSEIYLVDINEAKQTGEVMDMDDGLGLVATGAIKAGTFKDAAQADIIVITAGFAQKPGETRLDLVARNKQVIASIFKAMGRLKPTAIVIMVTNPVDILTYFAQKQSKLPAGRVFGSGTTLDTMRLKSELSAEFGVSTHNMHGFVVGEHGDSEVVAWSTVRVGSLGVEELKLSGEAKKAIEQRVTKAAYEIISRKGATFYGIAMAVGELIEAIIFDQHKLFPLSVKLDGWNGVKDVCLGVPCVLGRSGVEKVWAVELNSEEKTRFVQSAEAMKQYLK